MFCFVSKEIEPGPPARRDVDSNSDSTSDHEIGSAVHCSSEDISKSKTNSPVQPILCQFPTRNGRRFNTQLYKAYEWIEYSVQKDSVFCFACRHFGGVSTSQGDRLGHRVFMDKGFSCWKNMQSQLREHSESKRHVSAVVGWADFKAVSAGRKESIAAVIDSNRSVEIRQNRVHLKAMLNVTSLLGRQGLPFRGHSEDDEGDNKGNFLEAIDLLAAESGKEGGGALRQDRRYGQYSSPESQNEMIKVFGEKIKKIIVEEVKEAGYFSILVDETKDLSKKEQLAILVRYTLHGHIKERAIGTYHMKDLCAESLATAICDELSSQGIDMQLCVGQCYDGASVMRGRVRGVQARIREEVPHAVYIHCHAHRLNLVLVNTISDMPQMSEFFNIVQTLYNFIANSNTRHTLFVEAQTHLAQRVLQLERTCTTRWLYWYRAVQKIKLRYEAIVAVLDATMEAHAEGSLEAAGLKLKVESFPFVLHLHALERVLSVTYGLSEQLQTQGLVISRAATLIKSTKALLEKMRSECEWQATLHNAKAFASKVGLQTDAPIPRPRRVSKALAGFLLESTNGQRQLEEGDEDRRMFFEILDRFIMEFTQRFSENEGLICSIQAFDHNSPMFMDASTIAEFANLYESHIDTTLLQAQCHSAKAFLTMEKEDEEDDDDDGNGILASLSKLNTLPVAFSEVLKLFRIMATLPVSTASNERFFSVLKRVKTYLRTTMGDERLTHLMLMAVEQKLVKSLNMDDLVDDFAKMKPRRYPLMD